MIDSSSPNQPIQNYEIVNPTLESTIAQLLPSVAGYGGNLRSTNTIIPIVDVTGAAEGTQLRADLQSAFAFSNITAFEVKNTSSTLLNSPGYYRVFGSANIMAGSAAAYSGKFNLSDGLTTKTLINFDSVNDTGNARDCTIFDFVVLLDAGDTLSCVSSGNLAIISGSTRQIADIDGNLN